MIKVNLENNNIELDMTGDTASTIINELTAVNVAVLMDMAEKTKSPLEDVANALATAFLEGMVRALNEATNGNSN